jgi:hypothetical protein
MRLPVLALLILGSAAGCVLGDVPRITSVAATSADPRQKLAAMRLALNRQEQLIHTATQVLAQLRAEYTELTAPEPVAAPVTATGLRVDSRLLELRTRIAGLETELASARKSLAADRLEFDRLATQWEPVSPRAKARDRKTARFLDRR